MKPNLRAKVATYYGYLILFYLRDNPTPFYMSWVLQINCSNFPYSIIARWSWDVWWWLPMGRTSKVFRPCSMRWCGEPTTRIARSTQCMPWELAMEWSTTPARSTYQVTFVTRDRSLIALFGERALQSTWQFKLQPIMPLLCWGRHSLP